MSYEANSIWFMQNALQIYEFCQAKLSTFTKRLCLIIIYSKKKAVENNVRIATIACNKQFLWFPTVFYRIRKLSSSYINCLAAMPFSRTFNRQFRSRLDCKEHAV